VCGAQSNTIDQIQTNRVARLRTTAIGGDDVLLVTGNREEDVQLNMSNTVHGTRTDTVEQWEQRTVLGDHGLEVRGAHEFHVVGTTTVRLDSTRAVTVGGDDTETVTADKSTHVTGNCDITGDRRVVAAQAGAALTLTGGHAQLGADGHGEVTIGVQNGAVVVTAAQRLVLRCGAASLELQASGSIVLTGSTGVRMASGASSVAVAPSGVTENGPRITSAAVATHEISGALVRVG